MKGTFGFDPDRCDLRGATESVRRILNEWVEVDWFVSKPAEIADERAVRRFEKHQERARLHEPDLFSSQVVIRIERGGWRDFAKLCARVRENRGWDWKEGALKPLSARHSKRFNVRLQDLARVNLEDGETPDARDLFFCLGNSVIWQSLAPKFEPVVPWPLDVASEAIWYLSYAQMDVIAAVEWQVAECDERLDRNPFVPLIRCYDAGFYPFSLGPRDLVLFGWAALPKARRQNIQPRFTLRVGMTCCPIRASVLLT